MTTTVTKDQLEALSSNDNGQAVSETKKYTGEFEGKFIGTLVGNATTAKQLEQPYNFSLAGDAEGTVAVNASSVVLNTTVNHATEADTADFAGKTNLAARATLADMANTAEFAYRAGRFARVVINLTGAVIGSGEATNSETVDVKITDIDASNLFVVGSLATNPDTKKVYIDVTGRHFWIFDTVNSKWVDCFKTLADELDAHGLRLDALEALNAGDRLTALEGRADTLETTTVDHETRITANKKVIDNHELRLNNIETTTDLGQVTLRITAIEDKNTEQDASIGANATAITTESKAREDADNALGVRIDNADSKNTEQDTHLGTIDTHLGTIDTHLGTIDTHLGTIDEKNTAQDTALDTAKSEINTSISALSQKVQVNKADIDELKKQASSGLELLTVLIMPLGVDETENQFRYLNGQVIMQDQFADFTSKLKARMTLFPSLFTTEENWQAEKTNSKLGQCGKFVVNDTAGTIRLPCVVNIQGLTDLASIGEIKSESLPNITGDAGYSGNGGFFDRDTTRISGAFKKGQATTIAPTGDKKSSFSLAFDASGSSSTYQDNAPVQQEAIQYPYVIVVGVKAKEATKPINDYQVNNVYSFGMSQYYKGTMNNNSWLRSNNQWNSGTVYVDFYTWLLEHLNAGDAGFKSSTATDITDYDYVINTTDQTFKLPVKNGQEGVFASGVKGNGLTLGLTNGTENGGIFSGAIGGASVIGGSQNSYGNLFGTVDSQPLTGNNKSLGVTTDSTKSGIVVDTTVPSEYNLYYYVGDTLQNASLINIARIEEKLVDLSSASRGYLVESYHNGTDWYRIYSDGWCEQGGVAAAGGSITVTFLKAFSDTNYTACATSLGSTGEIYGQCINKISATQMVIANFGGSAMLQKSWHACGY